MRRRTEGFGQGPWYRRWGRNFSPVLLGGAVLVGVLTGSVATFVLQSPEDPPALEASGEEVPAPASALSVRVVEAADPPALELLESPPVVEAAPVVAPAPEEALTPPWQRYALNVDVAPGRPMIALVIDDMGLDRRRSREIVALPAPLTVSFLSYARELPEQTAAARAAGHELMLHMPMEPFNPDADPGPGALLNELSGAEVTERLTSAMAGFAGYVGVNNHMGSRFTEYETGMRAVMSVLRARGMLFIDSRTSGKSVAYDLARDFDVPAITRDVFLDHVPTREAVLDSLRELEEVATKKGFAVAIGHPRDATIEVLREWIPQAKARGFVLVPVSTLVAAQAGSG